MKQSVAIRNTMMQPLIKMVFNEKRLKLLQQFNRLKYESKLQEIIKVCKMMNKLKYYPKDNISESMH